MSKNTSLRTAVRNILLTSAASTAVIGATHAQESTIQEVVVTGSRIAQPNLDTTSPVTQVTAEDVITQGVTRIEDLVNQLPQAFAAQNSTVANGATGTATVNLRGLGATRTLVLIDGRRMPYGGVTPGSAAPDLNQIPTSLVERVEVLTGGASAVYGSDAVAGVVNFIMKKDFEGIQIDSTYSLYQHNNDYGGPGAVKLRDVIAARAASSPREFALPDDSVTDGNSIQGTLTMGVSTEDGRGNITAYASYQDNKAILQRDRDFSACSLQVGAPTVSYACGGSGTSAGGSFSDLGANNNAGPGPDLIPGTADDTPDTNPLPSYSFTVDENTGNFRPFTSADQYNFGPLNHYMRPDTRYSLGAMGHYELTEFADIYTQLMFTDVRSVAQTAPGGMFVGDVGGTINCDNPLLSAAQRNQIGCQFVGPTDTVPLVIGRRNVEGGGRQQSFHNSSFRGLIGSRGALADAWDYDVSMQFARTTADQLTLNFFSKPNIEKALDVVTDPATGLPVCRSALNGTDPGCVPYNIFQSGGVTPEALAYLQVPGMQQSVIDQNVILGAITGDLESIGGKLPWADESIKVAFGAENRNDRLTSQTDYLQTADLLSGAGGATIGLQGVTNVNDLFMEASIPLVQGRTGFEQLSFDTAYRYSDYSSGTTTDTYKLGMDWAPVQDVRFRASYQRAVRAPNVVELFTAQGFGLFDIDGDPCGAEMAGTPNEASAAACLASGVPGALLRSASLDNPAGQYNVQQGGDRELQPETSDTFSYGVVLTPRFAPGLSVSIDYFDIEVEDLISTFGADNTLNACYQFDDAAACSRINRNANGSLWIGDGHVENLNSNIGGLSTSGVDMNLNYNGWDIGNWGSLNFNLTGTYLIEIITDPGAQGFEPFDCAGQFAGACVSSLTTAVNPELRTRFRIGWQTPWNVDVAFTHRYISEVEMNGANPARLDYKLDAEHYFDLFAGWSVSDMANVRFGINNVLDEDPSLSTAVGTTGNGNTYPQVYDALGRYIFGGVTVKF